MNTFAHYSLMTVTIFILMTLRIQQVEAQDTKSIINQHLNNWHKAAASANLEDYFSFLADNAIFIGTDATERWDKEEFYKFSKPYFKKGNAWSFKPYDRSVIIDADKKVVWFSELLETWMGICRGSGVMTKEGEEWKLRQYHLSVTVPNPIIHDFIDLVDKNENK